MANRALFAIAEPLEFRSCLEADALRRKAAGSAPKPGAAERPALAQWA